jgi:hypothetical protein
VSDVVRTRRILIVLLVASALAACSGTGQPDATGTAAVEVTLEDFAVKPVTDSVGAGAVTFRVTNAGPSYPHELKVVKTDLDLAVLPTTPTGMLDQRGAGIDVVAEVDAMAEGANGEITVTLEAGNYVLLCNVYDDAGAHFQQGMLTAFTVTE